MGKSVNKGRVMEIELMKAVAIIGMIFVHVYEQCVKVNVNKFENFIPAYIIEFFGCIPSAGVFIFAMGWGASYSKRATPGTYVKRCVNLFILGLVINIFEEYVPAILCPKDFGPFSEQLPSILATDIYFFAALMSLYYALMKLMESNMRLAAVFSVLLVAVCFLTNHLVGIESFTTGNEWIDTILGLVIRVNEYSFFPFISWSFFGVVGLWAGTLFQKTDMKTFVKWAAVSGVIAMIVGEVLIHMHHLQDPVIADVVQIREKYYYGLPPVYAVAAYGLVALEFVVAHFILKATNNQIPHFMLTMSKNVSQIYVVQWIVIGFLTPTLIHTPNVWICIPAGLIVLFLSYYGGKSLKNLGWIKV
jgi:hypothetical protein